MRLPAKNTQNEWHYILEFLFSISKTWPYYKILNIKRDVVILSKL